MLKLNRRVMAFLLVVGMVFSLAACQGEEETPVESSLPVESSGEASGGGEEVPQEAFVISTVEELLDFARWTNETPLGEQAGVTWTLAADLDLTGVEWEPMGQYPGTDYASGDWKNGFGGILEGGGHRISGFRIVGKNPTHTGFFEVLGQGAVIRDLHLEGEVTGERYVGGLAGYGGAGNSELPSILIENCSFTGTVRGTYGETGGLMGFTGENTILQNCHVTGEVFGASSLGGFAGCAGNNSTLSGCTFSGTVTSNLPTANAEDFSLPLWEEWTTAEGELPTSGIGGFLGWCAAETVDNCWSDATLVTKAPCKWAGFFVGYHSSNDTNCYYNLDKAGDWTPGYAYPGSGASFSVEGLPGEEFAARVPRA